MNFIRAGTKMTRAYAPAKIKESKKSQTQQQSSAPTVGGKIAGNKNKIIEKEKFIQTSDSEICSDSESEEKGGLEQPDPRSYSTVLKHSIKNKKDPLLLGVIQDVDEERNYYMHEAETLKATISSLHSKHEKDRRD